VRPRKSTQPTVTLAQQRAAQREQERLALYNAHGWTEHDIATVDQMTGIQFEQYIARMIRAFGCTVTPTKATGDFGVDLIVSGYFAVQCKRQARAVGVSAIQQVIAGARTHNCSDRTIVISNQNYTPAARSMAAMHGVMLFDTIRRHR
jgi:restriction system protein